MTQDSLIPFSVQPLPGDVTHSYIFPGAAWEVPAQRATVMDSIPFTHPSHVPPLLELLRHQCATNTILRSCMCTSPGRRRTGEGHHYCKVFHNHAILYQWFSGSLPDSACDLHFEVLPESDTSFSVTFHRPDVDSLAVCEHFPHIVIKV